MWPLQVSGNLPDTGSKVKSQARAVMSRMMSLHAHVRCLRSCSCASCKEEVSLAATRPERRNLEAKGNADEAASELHKINNIGEDSEKHAILSVSTAKKLQKVSKANTGESAVKLIEHVAEDSEESHPMFKCT